MTLSTTPISDTKSKAIDIQSVISLVSDDMTLVNKTIASNLDSDVALINQLGAYIVQAGGKRLRPVALLLAACLLYTFRAHETSLPSRMPSSA